jgi:hypothetical protein
VDIRNVFVDAIRPRFCSAMGADYKWHGIHSAPPNQGFDLAAPDDRTHFFSLLPTKYSRVERFPQLPWCTTSRGPSDPGRQIRWRVGRRSVTLCPLSILPANPFSAKNRWRVGIPTLISPNNHDRGASRTKRPARSRRPALDLTETCGYTPAAFHPMP